MKEEGREATHHSLVSLGTDPFSCSLASQPGSAAVSPPLGMGPSCLSQFYLWPRLGHTPKARFKLSGTRDSYEQAVPFTLQMKKLWPRDTGKDLGLNVSSASPQQRIIGMTAGTSNRGSQQAPLRSFLAVNSMNGLMQCPPSGQGRI